MFLSKITVRADGQMAAWLLEHKLSDAYASHQLLWKLFSQDEQRSFLFREERSASGSPVFFVLSQSAPSQAQPLFYVQSKPFQPQLKQGQRLAYQLRVNPTRCRTDAMGKQKRDDVLMAAKKAYQNQSKTPDEIRLIMEQAAHSWIANTKRLQQWGVELNQLPDIKSYTQHKSQKKSGELVQFSSVDFQGTLTIADTSQFLQQYQQGFGRAKSMGCGLMLIRAI